MSDQQKQNAHPPEFYTFWVHCNICYRMYFKKECRFFLLACNHIACEICLEGHLQQTDVYKCNLCLKITKACEIGNAMPANLKELFHPEPFSDGLNAFRVMAFQNKHRQRYFAHQETMASRLEEYQRLCTEAKTNCQKLYQDCENFRHERKHLENRAKLIRQQRRQIDDNSSNKTSSVSSENTSASSLAGTAITSFSNLSQGNPFDL
uniref:RING-type domain-containing protein n=1 Tax=Musca domestica TaxID=7370 RepID=A0A1I8MYX4_MUSDO